MRETPSCRTVSLALLFTIYHSPFTSHHLPVTIHHLPVTSHHSPFTIHHSPVTIHYSPFTSHHSPVTIYQSPVTIHQSHSFHFGQPALFPHSRETDLTGGVSTQGGFAKPPHEPVSAKLAYSKLRTLPPPQDFGHHRPTRTALQQNHIWTPSGDFR